MASPLRSAKTSRRCFIKLPDFPKPPPSLDPNLTYRENLIEADCESLERMRKVAQVHGFTIYCDESERVGGELYFDLSLSLSRA